MELPQWWTTPTDMYHPDRIPAEAAYVLVTPVPSETHEMGVDAGISCFAVMSVTTLTFQPVDKTGDPCGEGWNDAWPYPPFCL